MLVGSISFRNSLRDRGCSAHPVFPAPSFLEEGERNGKLRAHRVARTWSRICSVAHPSRRRFAAPQDEVW